MEIVKKTQLVCLNELLAWFILDKSNIRILRRNLIGPFVSDTTRFDEINSVNWKKKVNVPVDSLFTYIFYILLFSDKDRMISTYFFIATLFSCVYGHGRIISPPGRSTMWRFGYGTPHNYNDNQLFCGGFFVSISLDRNLLCVIMYMLTLFGGNVCSNNK